MHLDRERRVVLAIAAAIVVLHLSFAANYGWFRDELYYVACANRLAWGYVDHPPLVAILARAARAIFGDSLVGLRFVAALAHAGAIVLTAEIARTIRGGLLAQTLAAGAMAIAPYELVIGHIYTMNAFEPVVWGGIGLVVARALRDDDAKPLLWLGPIVGLGILDKHSASWPVAGLAIAIALSPSRRLLVKRPTLIAAAIATLIVLPHVVWQVQNGLPTREFARAALSGKNEPYGIAGFVGQQIQLLHPMLAPLWIAGFLGVIVLPALRRFRPLGVAYLLVATLIVATQAKAYYLAPAATWLFALGGVVVERTALSRPRARLGVVIYGALAVVGGAVLAPAAIPILPVATFQRYAKALGVLGEQKSGEKMRPAALPQLYADMHGWPELAQLVERVSGELTPEERADAVVFASNYGQASAIEHFGHDLPPVASGNNGWWLWGPPRPRPSVMIAVGDIDRRLLDELFADVREVARIDHPLARADERDLPIYVCRDPKVSLADAWPRVKHYR